MSILKLFCKFFGMLAILIWIFILIIAGLFETLSIILDDMASNLREFIERCLCD